MKNPLIWLLVIITLGGLVIWWSADDAAPVEPLGVAHANEVAEAEMDPADLTEPAAEEPKPDNELGTTLTAEPQVATREDEQRRDPIAARKVIEFRGVVVDAETQAGLEACTVSLLSGNRLRAWNSIEPAVSDLESDEPGALRQTVTDAQGEFVIELREGELTGDAAVFVAVTNGWALLESQHDLSSVEIAHGAELRFEAKQWPPPSSGNISGWLRAEKGSFSADAIPRTDHILLDLVSTELPAIEMRAVLEHAIDEQGGFTISFLFEDVPRGEYT